MHPSQHQQSDGIAGYSLDSSSSSWRLSLLRSVMGDSICDTGSYISFSECAIGFDMMSTNAISIH